MAINDLYSKRQQRLRGDVADDVYQYTNIPPALRVQAIQLIQEIIGSPESTYNSQGICTEDIHNALCREYGVFSLYPSTTYDGRAISHFIRNEPEYERCLDAIELAFRHINSTVRTNPQRYKCSLNNIDDAISELNFRFKEAGVGYQFESGEIVRS